MLKLSRIALVIVVLAGSLACAQSGADSKPEPSPQNTQPEKNAPRSENKTFEQTIVSVPPDSTKLEAIKTSEAVYPLEAQDKELQGQVWVKIHVSPAGDVVGTEVISGDPVLAKSAEDAVRKWKFKPFIRDGKPVAVSTKLPFDFAFSGNVEKVHVPPDESDPAKTASSGDEETRKPVHVAAGVTTGLLIYKVQPVYPPEARRARIQGKVILRALISKEGRITDLHLISGPQELAEAAIGAVQQWRYRPYLLMGEPVVVDTEIQVNFQLR